MTNELEQKEEALKEQKQETFENRCTLAILRNEVTIMLDQIQKEIDTLMTKPNDLAIKMQDGMFDSAVGICLFGIASVYMPTALAIGVSLGSVGILGGNILRIHHKYSKEIVEAKKETKDRLEELIASKTELEQQQANLTDKIDALFESEKTCEKEIESLEEEKKIAIRRVEDEILAKAYPVAEDASVSAQTYRDEFAKNREEHQKTKDMVTRAKVLIRH